jgi:hypothetical protein
MKYKKHMTIALLIVATLVLILIAGKLFRSFQFKNEVAELFAKSSNISAKFFKYEQLSDLPEPVQRYFRHVLKDGQPFISYVRLMHDGQFKAGLDKDWTNIQGEQYFTAEKPGFIWKGTTSMFTARDVYVADKGRLIVTLFSLYNIVNGSGENFNEGELQRWLAESVWFPTNLLPNERNQWSPIDANSAKLSFKYRSVSFSYIVTFNEIGEILQMETKRFMGEEKREAWLCKMACYKKINDVIIPMKAEVIWKLEKGEVSYAKFNVKKIEFDLPKKF